MRPVNRLVGFNGFCTATALIPFRNKDGIGAVFMRIATVVRAGAVALLLTLCAAGWMAANRIDAIRFGGPLQLENQEVSDLVADILPPPSYIIEPYLEATLLVRDPALVEERALRLAQLRKDFDARQTYWQQSALQSDARTTLTGPAHDTAMAFWQELDEVTLPAARAGDSAALATSYDRLSGHYAAHRQAIDAAVAGALKYRGELHQRSDEELSHALWMLGLAGAVTAGMASLAVWWILASVVGPMTANARTMTAMAGGDVGAPVSGETRADEIGDMARALALFRQAELDKRALQVAEADNMRSQQAVIAALSEALKNLASGNVTYKIDHQLSGQYEVLRQDFNSAMTAMASALRLVSQSSQTIRHSATEVSAASADLSMRTETQASRLQFTSETLKTVSAAVSGTATRARDVRTAVETASAAAEEGGRIVFDAVKAMNEIQQSAGQISDIVALIDGISFQTNLLALNAGVEAARAGEAGSGFAVVANEVRALAQRAADAARDIRGLIVASNAQVDNGAMLVTAAGTKLTAIMREVSSISSLVHDIAHAVDGESGRLIQVSESMSDIDLITQQNAAMVEQSSAAARMLAEESEKMATLVTNFRVEMPNGQDVDAALEEARREAFNKFLRAA